MADKYQDAGWRNGDEVMEMLNKGRNVDSNRMLLAQFMDTLSKVLNNKD